MQYLLSEEEYKNLVSRDEMFESKRKLQIECTRIANEFPVSMPGTMLMVPHGCVITHQLGTCDNCVVKNICPYDWKTSNL